MITYLKTAFTNPKYIYTGRNMKKRHTFYLMLLTSALLTFISLFQYIPILNGVSEDFNDVKASIPTFSLEDNKISSETESYIYQTDSLLFYFDPDNRIDIETIRQNTNRVSAPLTTALLQEGLYLNIVGQDFYLGFDEVENITTEDIESLIASIGEFSTPAMLLAILGIFIIQFSLFTYELLPITLFANIISIFNQLKLKLSQTFKIVLLAVIPLSIILNLIHTFIFPISSQFEILLIMSMFIYYRSIKLLKKKLLDSKL